MRLTFEYGAATGLRARFGSELRCRLGRTCAKTVEPFDTSSGQRFEEGSLKRRSATFSVTDKHSILAGKNPPSEKPVELSDPLWERQNGESKKAYEAFEIYRDQEKRSYAEVGRRLGKSKKQIEKWGSRWHWVVRVAGWDREIEREKIKASKKVRAAALDRQRAIAISLQTLAGYRVRELLNLYEKTRSLDEQVAIEVAQREAAGQIVTEDDKIKIRAQIKAVMGGFEEFRLSAKDVKDLFHEGVFVERLVMGEPTEHRVDMTAEELLRKRVSDAVADARINHSEYPTIDLRDHLQWAANDYGVGYAAVLEAAGLATDMPAPMPPRQLSTSLAPNEESDSVS